MGKLKDLYIPEMMPEYDLKLDFTINSPEAALEFANYAHRFQVDKVGTPYILHVVRVGAALWRFGNESVMAGFLHDVVEDTDYTLEDLAYMETPVNVLNAVRSVTKHTSESDLTEYEASIRRAMNDPIGLWVKAADVSDNGSRIDDLPPGKLQNRMIAKYMMAEDVLQEKIPDYWIGCTLVNPS